MGAQLLFQIFVWTTSGSFRALSAPVDTRFFAQGYSIIGGPTVDTTLSQVCWRRKHTMFDRIAGFVGNITYLCLR